MSKSSGILVTYTDLDGNTQRGVLRYSDQSIEFEKRNKALICLLDNDLKLLLDQDRRPRIALKSKDLLTHIGYCD